MAAKSSIYKYQPLWGTWRVGELICQNTYGEIYRVYKEEWGRMYVSAVKLISVAISEADIREAEAIGIDADSMSDYFKSHVDSIINEIEVMYRLRGNSNIVAYEDHMIYQKKGGLGWDILIRMEFLKSLPDYMHSHDMTRDDVIKLGIDICKALEACQKAGIIHRDIRDVNIFVSDKGEFKLGNFGAAKELSKLMGTTPPQSNDLFMAPEIYGRRSFEAAADIYSLGILLYKLLNKGRMPFLPLPPNPITVGDTEYSLQCRLSGKELTLPADADEKLGKIILKACSYNQKDRYKSPGELRQKLERLTKPDSRAERADAYIACTTEKPEKIQKESIPEQTLQKDKPPADPKRFLTNKKHLIFIAAITVILSIGIVWALSIKPSKNTVLSEIPIKPPVLSAPSPSADMQVTPTPTGSIKDLPSPKTGKEYYDEGTDYLKKKQYDMALKAFENAKRMEYNLNKTERQISGVRKLIQAQKLYASAMEYYGKRQFGDALNSFRQLSALSVEYKSLKQYADTFFQLASSHNLSGVEYFNSGKLQMAVNEFNAALDMLSEMKASTSKYDTELCEKWRVIYSENKLKAQEKLEKVRDNLKLADECNKSGVRLFNENNKVKAKEEFEKAVKYMEEIRAIMPYHSFQAYEGVVKVYNDNLNRSEKYGK